jgi:hypothetical protein
MHSFVFDYLYIRSMERNLKRKLTEEELEQVQFGEILFVQTPDHFWLSFVVPFYKFPQDLVSKAVDLRGILGKSKEKNFHEYVEEVGFNGGVKIG